MITALAIAGVLAYVAMGTFTVYLIARHDGESIDSELLIALAWPVFLTVAVILIASNAGVRANHKRRGGR